MPEFIEVDIRNLAVGSSIHVKNLPQLKGVTYKTSADDVVVSCVSLSDSDDSTETEEAAAEGATEATSTEEPKK